MPRGDISRRPGRELCQQLSVAASGRTVTANTGRLSEDCRVNHEAVASPKQYHSSRLSDAPCLNQLPGMFNHSAGTVTSLSPISSFLPSIAGITETQLHYTPTGRKRFGRGWQHCRRTCTSPLDGPRYVTDSYS